VTAQRKEIAIIPFASDVRVEFSVYRPRQTQQSEITKLFSERLIKAVNMIVAPFER
jgi:hypothetical protein